MKLFVLSSLTAVVVAHDANLHVRQRTSTAPSSASSSTTTAAVSSPTPSGLTTLTFTLASTNPTAFPLSSITANQASLATIPLPSTPAAGEQPSITLAPPLPDAANINSANYPPMDKSPPTDSPEVQQWIQEVANSGVPIPGLSPTLPGGCPANPDVVADTSRCWWTCGGCVRNTDIQDCPAKLTWGLTYDDGPSFYTPNLLAYLTEQKLLATFFVVGSRAVQFPHTLQEEYIQGHQIAVHTWSHPALTTLSNEAIIAELGWTKKIIKDVTGVTPNMMRPPFGDIDDRVRNISIAMGLTPVMWSRMSQTATFDTDDFNVHGGLTTSEQVLNNWNSILNNGTSPDRQSGFIVLEHDLFEETVELATGYILPDALGRQPPLTIQPVISCLNKPLRDAYIETNDNSTNPPAASGVVTFSPGAPGSAQATGSGNNAISAFDAERSILSLVTVFFLSLVVFQL